LPDRAQKQELEPKKLMNQKQIKKVQARVLVLEKLINSFKYCKKLVRRFLAELLDKEAILARIENAVPYSVSVNGQLSLF
jgi:hypothetical protein